MLFNNEEEEKEKKETQGKLSVKGVDETPKRAPEKIEKPQSRIDEASPINTDPKIDEYEDKLFALRKDGQSKIVMLKDDIYDTKHNKMLSPKERQSRLQQDEAELKQAKEIAAKNKDEVRKLAAEAKAYTKALGKDDYQKQKLIGKDKVAQAKAVWLVKKEEVRQKHAANVQKLKEDYSKKSLEVQDTNAQALKAASSEEDRQIAQEENKNRLSNLKQDYDGEMTSEKVEFKNEYKDEKLKYTKAVQEAKDLKHGAYLAMYNEVTALNAGHNSFGDNFVHKYEAKIYNFTWLNYILNNALYIVVIAFFIACSIITPITQGYQLLTINNLVSLIDNASTRVFFALGVGGLILLGGTDLSIGRIIGMGTFIVGFVLHSSSDGTQATHFFKLTSTVGGSLGGRIILAFVLTLAACVFFSALAGFFSARFKMHPFITTLSTMMVIYGLMMVATAGIPTGPVDKDLAQAVVGHIKFEGDTGPGFPKYLIYAVIAVAICWFIWNKTKFGKDIYAVGGNPEAAAVSGISYFKVTLGVFILAGVFYGIGCFLYGFASNPAANNGYGYELDAIAACVVGGISFFGGIGKVKGAVIGVLIFSGLSTVLTIMNVSSYWQFVIKGLILMTAVALDSVKYLKRK
jgi:methyl-galactoside transport system permease protein